MCGIIITEEIFNEESPLSIGLICGLKKLYGMDFEISLHSGNSEALLLKKICKNEGIKFIDSIDANTGRQFVVTTKESTYPDNYSIIKLSSDGELQNFNDAMKIILSSLRTSEKIRTSNETNITIKLSLDGDGTGTINTGIGFFDHMLLQIVKHSNINMRLDVKGDLEVDEHHTVEDTGIVFGEAVSEALGHRKGIKRFGFLLPMDDCIAKCAVDLGGRSYLNFKTKFSREKVGEFPTELTEEFFKGVASGLKANIYINAKGKNDHHKIESIFKAFGKALNEACRFDERSANSIPSTKGIL